MLIWYFVSQSECQEEIEQIVHTFRYFSQREVLRGNVTVVDNINSLSLRIKCVFDPGTLSTNQSRTRVKVLADIMNA